MSFVSSIRITAESLEQLAKGDFSDRIDEKYQGDFNEIRIYLNSLTGAVNDITRLAEGMANGNFSVEVSEKLVSFTILQTSSAYMLLLPRLLPLPGIFIKMLP